MADSTFEPGDEVCWVDSDGRGGKLAYSGRYVGADPWWSNDRSVVTRSDGKSASVQSHLLRKLPEAVTVTVRVGRDEVHKVLRMLDGNADMKDPSEPRWSGDDCALAEVLFYEALNAAVVADTEPF